MCGIVGFVSVKKLNTSALVEGALMQRERGFKDGVGLIYWKDKWNVKKTLKPLDKQLIKLFKHETTIGVLHHRLASAGSINLDNVHPVKHDNIYVVHNGHSYLGELEVMKYQLHNASDTKGVAMLLNKNGVELILDIGDGAYVIMKEDEKALYIVRDGYPLYLWISKDFRTLLFASTEKAIITTAAALKLKPYEYKSFASLRESALFKVTMDKKIAIKLIDEIKPKASYGIMKKNKVW